jgi:hypothetical protein
MTNDVLPPPGAPEDNRLVDDAFAIADEATRIDIESYCACEQLGRLVWYDLLSPRFDEQLATVECAASYLLRRQRLVRHPAQPRLVRFA